MTGNRQTCTLSSEREGMENKYRKVNNLCSRKHAVTCTANRTVKTEGGEDAIVGDSSTSSLRGSNRKTWQVGIGQEKSKYSSTFLDKGQKRVYSPKNSALSTSGSSENSQPEVESGIVARISHPQSRLGIDERKYSLPRVRSHASSGNIPLVCSTTFEHGSSSQSADELNYKKPLKSSDGTRKLGGVTGKEVSQPRNVATNYVSKSASGSMRPVSEAHDEIFKPAKIGNRVATKQPLGSMSKRVLDGSTSKNANANNVHDSKNIVSHFIKKPVIDRGSPSRIKSSFPTYHRSKGNSSEGTEIGKNRTVRSRGGLISTRKRDSEIIHCSSSGSSSASSSLMSFDSSSVQTRNGKAVRSKHVGGIEDHKAANSGKLSVIQDPTDFSTGIESEQRLPKVESSTIWSLGDPSSSVGTQSPVSTRGFGDNRPDVNNKSVAPKELTEPAKRSTTICYEKITQSSIKHNLLPSRSSYEHQSLERGSDTGIASSATVSTGSSFNSASTSVLMDDLATTTSSPLLLGPSLPSSDFNSLQLFANGSPSSPSLLPEAGISSILSDSLESPDFIGGLHMSHFPPPPPPSHVERREQIPALEPLDYRPSQELQYQLVGDGHFQQIVEGISEILSTLEHEEGNDDFSFQHLLMQEAVLLLGGIGYHHGQHHRDLWPDVDNMTYEELLALEERIGNVSTGLDEDKISKCLKQALYICSTSDAEEMKCIICQDEFEEGAELGVLDCGHSYHVSCIKQWLSKKNQCPVCKMSPFNDISC